MDRITTRLFHRGSQPTVKRAAEVAAVTAGGAATVLGLSACSSTPTPTLPLRYTGPIPPAQYNNHQVVEKVVVINGHNYIPVPYPGYEYPYWGIIGQGWYDVPGYIPDWDPPADTDLPTPPDNEPPPIYVDPDTPPPDGPVNDGNPESGDVPPPDTDTYPGIEPPPDTGGDVPPPDDYPPPDTGGDVPPPDDAPPPDDYPPPDDAPPPDDYPPPDDGGYSPPDDSPPPDDSGYGGDSGYGDDSSYGGDFSYGGSSGGGYDFDSLKVSDGGYTTQLDSYVLPAGPDTHVPVANDEYMLADVHASAVNDASMVAGATVLDGLDPAIHDVASLVQDVPGGVTGAAALGAGITIAGMGLIAMHHRRH